MKLILRKNDSVMSMLLFIYNNYLSLTNKGTLKLSSLLEIMKVFGKNETAVRMALSRASKAEILINMRKGNEVSYALTSEGREVIELWNTGVKCFWQRYQLRNKSWNGKWYFLNINLNEDKKSLKPVIIDKLQQIGFASISTNIWMNPYYLRDEVAALVDEYSIKDAVVQIYGEMEIYKNINEFLDEIFCIGKLKASYNDFVKTYKDKLDESKIVFQKKDFTDCGIALPLLHELGWNFFNIASEDPILPRELLPIWEGDEAADIMKEFREILLKSVNQYLQKFE